MGRAHPGGGSAVLRRVVGALVRRAGPRSVAALEEVPRLREQLESLHHRLDETRAELDHLSRVVAESNGVMERMGADVGEVHGRTAQLDADVAETRRLSLRVAQLTDLVFDRLSHGGSREESRD